MSPDKTPIATAQSLLAERFQKALKEQEKKEKKVSLNRFHYRILLEMAPWFGMETQELKSKWWEAVKNGDDPIKELQWHAGESLLATLHVYYPYTAPESVFKKDIRGGKIWAEFMRCMQEDRGQTTLVFRVTGLGTWVMTTRSPSRCLSGRLHCVLPANSAEQPDIRLLPLDVTKEEFGE
jgi:hypothetical protein